MLEMLGPRIKFTRKNRVTADGQDIGRWEKLGDQEWVAYDSSTHLDARNRLFPAEPPLPARPSP